MMIYSQSLGKFWFKGLILCSAYSGQLDGLNNPAMEHVRNIGPIPRGLWHITEWLDKHKDKGPIVARLSMKSGLLPYGRDGFLIHGDNSHMNFTASEGCIIMARQFREHIRRHTNETILEVIG